MNKKTFESLPKHYQRIVQVAAGYQVMYTFAESEAMQFDAMAEMRDKHKVQIRRWSDNDIAAFEKAWNEVIQEESAKDPLFKKVADDYLAFRKKYAVWGDSQAMKATYLGK
jgi:TRAP-type mannitol/chloroaromatic compound transport system substrate-binding protein